MNISIVFTFVNAYILCMAHKRFDLPKFFQALGDTTRLRLLNLLGEQEVCVCYFVEILVLSQRFPGISHICATLASFQPGAKASGCTTAS